MTQNNDEQDYQDPVLTPGNLRKIVQSLPGKSKSQHTDYDYYRDTNILKNEIDEFFNYTEVTVQLQDYRRLYDKEYKQNTAIKDIIASLLDKLESSNQDIRIQACKHFIHLSVRTTEASSITKVDEVIENNQMLLSCGVFSIVHQKLQLSIKEYHQSTNNRHLGISTEIDLYLTLLYMLLETQRLKVDISQRFKDELILLCPNLIEVLFFSVAKTREKLEPYFPMKKTILLLWKSMLFISGGLETIKLQGEKQRNFLGFADSKNTIITKCTLEDYLVFQNKTLRKYPGFNPPNFPIDIASPLTIGNSQALTKLMGYSKAAEKIDFLYQTLFPPKTIHKTNNTRNHHLLQEYSPEKDAAAFPLPLLHTGSNVPKSIQEAGDVFIDNMYISLGSYQMAQEKSKAMHHWQSQSSPQTVEKETIIDMIYSNILPYLQSFIVVILKLLLSSVTTNSSQKLDTEDFITLEYLEQADTLRNKEILTKSISGLLLVFLKWTKSSYILKFEYISQLLVDSGCLLLVLKMIGLQEVSELVQSQTDVPYYGFFDFNIHRTSQPDEDSEVHKTNWRNMYWMINLMRILQLLTKHKPHRTMLMAQYKSAAILKRVLRIGHPVLEQYTLKLLKNQIPYLGKKWRSQNMKIISSIYLNCKTVLKDDWISKIESEDDEEHGKMQERVMRLLIQIYHHNQYELPLPVHDELDSPDEPSGPGYSGWIDYDLHKNLEEDDTNTTNLYDYDVTPAPSPVESRPMFMPEELDREINKLYLNELNSEVRANLSSSDAHTSPLPRKLTPLSRYDGEKMTYSKSSYTEHDNIEDEKKKKTNRIASIVKCDG